MHPSSRARSQVGSCSHVLKTFLSLWSYLRTSRDKTSINWDYKVSHSLSKQEVRTEDLMNKMMLNVSPLIFRHYKKQRRAVISPAIFSMPLATSVFIPNSLLLNISNCDVIQEYYRLHHAKSQADEYSLCLIQCLFPRSNRTLISAF